MLAKALSSEGLATGGRQLFNGKHGCLVGRLRVVLAANTAQQIAALHQPRFGPRGGGHQPIEASERGIQQPSIHFNLQRGFFQDYQRA